MPRFRTPYNYDTDVVSHDSGLAFSEPGLTQQNFKDETDINTLVRTYARTGVIPGSDLPAVEFDAGEITDYQSALNQLIEADRSFLSLPSDIRTRFQNDPGLLLSFLADNSNRDEAISLGLIPPPQPSSEPTPTPVSDNPAPVKD